MSIEFKETMFMGDNENQPQKPESETVNPEILEVNNKITQTQDFIASLEGMQGRSPTDARKKDIINAKIDLAELQTKKQELLDEKYMKIPSSEHAANDSQIMSDSAEGSWKHAA